MTAFKRPSLPAIFVKFYEGLREFDKDLLKSLNELITNMSGILERGISFGDNVDCRLLSFTSSVTPNAENTVLHNLGKVPIGFLVYSTDKAAHLYKGSTTWGTSTIYLKSDVASVAFKIIVF